jgi:hypothetical protein
VGIAGEHLTGEEMARGMSRALGKEIGYTPIPPAAFRAFDFQGADDLGNMFQYKHDFNEEFCAARPIEASRALNPELLDFAGWLERHGARIPIG